jgi:predicted transcriptional regulator
LFKNKILDNKKRRKIYSLIKKNPGIHLRGLQRRLSFPISTLYYHVNFLKRYRIIVAEKDGVNLRFFIEPLNKEEKRLLGILRKRRCREIISLVLINQVANTKILEENLNIPSSTLSFYLNYLIQGSILKRKRVGYEHLYTVSDEDRIIKILTTYKSSLLDRLVDKTLNTWLETRYGK